MSDNILPIGALVRVSDPDQYVKAYANRVRDRIGTVTGHTYPTSYPIVVFPKRGRFKELRIVAGNHRTFELAP